MAAKVKAKAKAKPAPKAKAAHAKKAASKDSKKAKAVSAAPKKGPAVAAKKGPLSESEKRKAKAAAAVKAAMAASNGAKKSQEEEDEFDPAAFFEASGGKGLFKAHVMRKERVDMNLAIRFRLSSDPLVRNAELINLSKGGLCIKSTELVKAKSVIRIEIPLPHTSELFAVQAEVVWSQYVPGTKGKDRPAHTGLRFMPMSLAKQTVINQFIQQRRDELIMAKIGLDKFTDSVPVAGLD